MFAIFNPVVGVLHNMKLNRWHPVLFQEAPLPGPPSEDKPVRHKSKGHHTEGFETREAALESARKLAEDIKDDAIGGVAVALEKDVPWDGEDIPAMTAFFKIKDGKAELLF